MTWLWIGLAGVAVTFAGLAMSAAVGAHMADEERDRLLSEEKLRP